MKSKSKRACVILTVATLLSTIQLSLNARAQATASVTICGNVSAFTAASATLPGMITIGGQTLPIAAGTTITNSSLIALGANLCLRATLNASAQIVAPSEVRANVTTTVTVCGTVTAFAAATSTAAGLITIAGQTIPIAAGTVISNQDLIRAGANLCLNATLNAFGEIIVPSSVTASATTTVTICGTVTAFLAATSTADGSITIAGQTIPIAAGTSIGNQSLITAGANLCLSATLNAFGQIIVPSSVTVAANTTVTICGTVTAFVAATATSAGSITIGGQTFQIAAGTNITNSDLIKLGVDVCLNATINVNGQIISPTSATTNHPPKLNLPGPQTVQVGNTLNFSVSATDQDAGDTVTLSASNVPQGASFNATSGNPANGQFTFTPSQTQAGQKFTVGFTATDSQGASSSGSVDITVTSGPPRNTAPTISVPGPQTIDAGSTLKFVVTASDADGDSITLSASSIPANGSFEAGSGLFTFTPAAAQVGQVFVVTFTATDSAGLSTSAPVQITVVGPGGPGSRPPVISVPPSPIGINVDDVLVFLVAAISPTQGCNVTLSASGLPDHATFDPATGKFTFHPTADQKGKVFTVTFKATDCSGQMATATVTIIVLGDINATTGGHICIPVTKVFFAPAPVGGTCGFITVSVVNMGGAAMTVKSMSLADGQHFRLQGIGGLPLMLQAAELIQLTIAFEPKTAGTLVDTLTLVTDDTSAPVVTIQLKGKGVNQ